MSRRSARRRSTGSSPAGGRSTRGSKSARRMASLDGRERLLERRHEVGHGRALLLGLGRLDRLALALLADDALEALLVAVLVAVRVPVAGERLDQLDRLVELLLRRL